ncbi:unnamed protein product [Caenorhabditis auriculariae]|uniref:Uncharacterized protein n=1 Tax=Caenorhabditis auriculariae TaxID=2777116 RepID=A0A8S1HIT1_9PELO|nr:unnamed protein product [Caenorhabditis auriculariae]
MSEPVEDDVSEIKEPAEKKKKDETEIIIERINERNRIKIERIKENFKHRVPAKKLATDFLQLLEGSIQRIRSNFYRATARLAMDLFKKRPIAEANKFLQDKADFSLNEIKILEESCSSIIDRLTELNGVQQNIHYAKMKVLCQEVQELSDDIDQGLATFEEDEIVSRVTWQEVSTTARQIHGDLLVSTTNLSDSKKQQAS